MSFKKVFLCVVFIAIANVSFSDEYSAIYSLGTRLSYDDNITGTTNDPLSATANIISPSLKTTWATENANADLGINLDFYKYNRPGYDTDNQNINLATSWNYVESQEISLNAQIVRDSTTTSDAQVEDTGVINFQTNAERRIEKTFSPSWSWQFNEQDRFSISYDYSEVDYGDATRYTGNEVYNVTPSISHMFREDWSVFLQADYSVSDTDERELTGNVTQLIIGGPYATYSTETTTKGVALGSNYQMTENWSLNGYVGKNTSDGEYDVSVYPNFAEFCVITRRVFLQGVGFVVPSTLPECQVLSSLNDYSSDGSYANVSLKWSQELWNVTTSYNSNVSPSSDGYAQQLDRLGLSSNYKLTENQSINFNLAYVENTVVDRNSQQALGINRDRETTSLNLGWRYQLEENWSINASYQKDETDYRGSSVSLDAYTVKSELFVFGIVWQPQKHSWSN